MDKKYAVYFFAGEDEFRKNISINKVKTKLSLNSESLDYNIYYGKDAKASDIIQSLKTAPALTRYRLVVLKDADKLSDEDKEKLILYFKKPNPTSILIITTQKDSSATDKLIALGTQYAKCIDFSALKAEEISSWIKQEFKARNKSIDPQALGYLKENTAANLDIINNYIEQICLYAGKKGTIDKKDVEALVEELSENSTFKLIDEIGLKKSKSALNILTSLLGAGKDAHEILGLIAWHIRRLGRVKISLNAGRPCEEIAKNLKISYYIAQKIAGQTKNFTLHEIKKAQALLLDADLKLKRNVSNPKAILQVLVMRLSSNL